VISNIILALALAIFLLERMTSLKEVARFAGEAIGPASMLGILGCSVSQFNGCGIVGVLLFAVAAVVVKTEGEMFSLKRVDLFHYVLVVATVALMKGLEVSNSLPDIYYRSEEQQRTETI